MRARDNHPGRAGGGIRHDGFDAPPQPHLDHRRIPRRSRRPQPLTGVADVRVEGATLHCQVDTENLGELIRLLGDAGVRSLVSQPPTLEELFLRHYQIGGQRTHSSEEVTT